MSDVERIKDRLNILDVVGQYVKLEKAGKHYKGLSPFTSENTPSFFVSPDKGLYHCFSSGRGGDIFTFIQEVEGLDFQGSLRFLADQAGVELKGYDPKKKKEKDRIYHALEVAAEFFRQMLSGSKEAQEYIKGRGIDDKTSLVFRLGYAPDDWHELDGYLKEKGVTQKDAHKAGLLKKSDRGYYDLFRDRIMFPIRDAAGRIVGFSGRILHPNDKAPKYVNSPETPVYHKSRILYGYYRARQAMRKNNFAILVEGQMDLVLSHQAGFPTTVAVSGTSLTNEHLSLVRRYTDNLLFVFDNDKAGWASMLKSSLKALPLGMNLKTIELPEGSDPADIINDDPDKWKELVRSATHVIEAICTRIAQKESDRHKQWNQVQKTVLPLLRAIPNAIERAHFMSLVSEKTGIPLDSIKEEVGRSAGQRKPTKKEEKQEKSKRPSRPQALAEEISGILVWKEDDEDVDTKKFGAQLGELLERGSIKVSDKGKRAALFRGASAYHAHSDISELIEQLLCDLKEEIIREELREMGKKVGEHESNKDEEKEDKAKQEFENLKKELREVVERKNAD